MQPVKRKREPSGSWFAFLHPAPPAGPLSGVALGACSSGLSAVLTPKPAGLGRSDYLVAVGLPPPGFPVCVSTGWRPVPAPRHVTSPTRAPLRSISRHTQCFSVKCHGRDFLPLSHFLSDRSRSRCCLTELGSVRVCHQLLPPSACGPKAVLYKQYF